MPWYPVQVISCCSTNWSHFRKSSRIPYKKTAWEWLESMVLFTNWFWLICRNYEYDISIHTRMLWTWILPISGSLEAAPLTNKKRQPTVATQCLYQKTYSTFLMNTIDIYIYMSQNYLVINPSSGQTCAWKIWPNKKMSEHGSCCQGPMSSCCF